MDPNVIDAFLEDRIPLFPRNETDEALPAARNELAVLFPPPREGTAGASFEPVLGSLGMEQTFGVEGLHSSDTTARATGRQDPMGNLTAETKDLLRETDFAVVEKYFGLNAIVPDPNDGENPFQALFSFADSAMIREKTLRPLSRSNERGSATLFASGGGARLQLYEARIAFLQTCYGRDIPEPIWDCCKGRCFAQMAIDLENVPTLVEIRRICMAARKLFDAARPNNLVRARLRGLGGSSLTHATAGRASRPSHESIDDPSETDRLTAAKLYYDYCEINLPYLRGVCKSSHGVPPLPQKICMQAVCCILGCSLNFFYRRRKLRHGLSSADGALFLSLIDSAGIRQRQHRRVGSREGYPTVEYLPSFECGCEQPCWAEIPSTALHRLYSEFVASSKQPGSQRKETQFLLNAMFSPLTNSVERVCNNALSALYTVSVGLVEKVRSLIVKLCEDPAISKREPDPHGLTIYRKLNHPMNKLPHAVRVRVEQEIDIITRSDPGAADNSITVRVYNPEVNTHEKLAQLIMESVCDDVDVSVHPSTIRRIVQSYMEERGFRLSFSTGDHNACPNCKDMSYAALRFHHEGKVLLKRLAENLSSDSVQLLLDLETARFQETETATALQKHQKRHFNIRKLLSDLITYFKVIENQYREREAAPFGWCERKGHGHMKHQDASSKIDLPSIIVETSSDITRWRFDASAHCCPINGDAVVFSHEQGHGRKNTSAIIELILLDHLLSCRGESIKVILSDCAPVGRCWLSTVTLPQYMVDQGLCEIVLTVFFENNHGKYIADQLFGQLQRRRLRSTIVGIDSLLAEFEKVKKRRGGKVSGFAVNPLASVDFASVFHSLGYSQKPPPSLEFSRRNIHFSAASKAGVKETLDIELLKVIGDLLPDNEGMVRLTSEPPLGQPKNELMFDERFIDVPAASMATTSDNGILSQSNAPPLVVAMDLGYSQKGDCVVSTRNEGHVGYNGYHFRGMRGLPELSGHTSRIVREAWPPDLIGQDAEHGVGVAAELKCAPENWVVRLPVSHFTKPGKQFAARYPPRNLLNSRAKRGPRDPHCWVPVQTYYEPPFPIIEGTSACEAAKAISHRYADPHSNVNVLDIISVVFEYMGDERENLRDPWRQNEATRPSREAILEYRSTLGLLQHRKEGRPKPPRKVWNFFQTDQVVKDQANRIFMANLRASTSSESRAQIVSRLYQETQKSPQGLKKYEEMAVEDERRFARELKIFRETTQKQFDRSNGLLPVSEVFESHAQFSTVGLNDLSSDSDGEISQQNAP